MPQVLIETTDFPNTNPWGVGNGQTDVAFTLDELLHAAATAGHDYDWQLVFGAELAGLYEILWKAYALLLCVREEAIPRQQNRATLVDRFVSTNRFWGLDPSEKRGASYHLGILFAVAWARRSLNVPWLLHLDVYRARLNPHLQPGNSRPDLVGRDTQGRWVVLECKGRASSPDQDAKQKAKAQSQRVISVGGQAPSLDIAFFSYFGPDKAAAGRRKPWVLRGLAIDPDDPEQAEEPIDLSDLTEREFFRLYYEPFQSLFRDGARLEERDGVQWRDIEGLDFKIGMASVVRELLLAERYEEIPRKLALIYQHPPAERPSRITPDGMAVDAGDRWVRQLKAER